MSSGEAAADAPDPEPAAFVGLSLALRLTGGTG